MHDFAPRKTFRGVFHPSKHAEPKNYRYARIGSNKKILPTDDVNRIDEKSTRKRGARGRPGRHEPFLQGDKEGGSQRRYARTAMELSDRAKRPIFQRKNRPTQRPVKRSNASLQAARTGFCGQNNARKRGHVVRPEQSSYAQRATPPQGTRGNRNGGISSTAHTKQRIHIIGNGASVCLL